MNDKQDIGFGYLDTFKSIRREHLANGKTIHYFEYTFKDGVDPDLAQQTATGLSIAYVLDRAP
jgi:hypothetical protein